MSQAAIEKLLDEIRKYANKASLPIFYARHFDALCEYKKLQSESKLTQALNKTFIWSIEVFGTGPESVKSGAKHLLREAQELIDSDGTDPMEIADIVIIASNIAKRQGYDLAEIVSQKFEILKTREWGEPDHEGVIEHIKEAINDTGRTFTIEAGQGGDAGPGSMGF